MNVTTKSTKQEIIEEGAVIIAELDEQVTELRQQKLALFAVASVLLVINFIWYTPPPTRGAFLCLLIPPWLFIVSRAKMEAELFISEIIMRELDFL